MYKKIYVGNRDYAIPAYIDDYYSGMNIPYFPIFDEEYDDKKLEELIVPTRIDGSIIDWKQKIKEPPIEFSIVSSLLREVTNNAITFGLSVIDIDGYRIYVCRERRMVISDDLDLVQKTATKKDFLVDAYGIHVSRNHPKSYISNGKKYVITGFLGTINYAPLVVYNEGIFSVISRDINDFFRDSVFSVEWYYPLATFEYPIRFDSIIADQNSVSITVNNHLYSIDTSSSDKFFNSVKHLSEIYEIISEFYASRGENSGDSGENGINMEKGK